VSANVQSRSHRRPGTFALLAVTGVVALAGCGSSSSSSNSSSSSTPATSTPASTTPPESGSSPGAGNSLSLSANVEGQLAFSTTSLTAKAGKVTIAFTNMSPLKHNMTIESASGERVGGTETFTGGTKTLSLTLRAGTYKFFCTVPGHRQAGMEGTLTVTS
jgi:plastocyanin